MNVSTYINETNFPKATTTAITNANLATAATPLPGGTKLKGKLIIKDYLNLEEVKLDRNELEEVTFINCPKLKKIDVQRNRDGGGNPMLGVIDIEKLTLDVVTGEPKTSNLESLQCGFNKIVKIDFTHCQKLKIFGCPENPTLDLIENIDRVEGIEEINMVRSGPVKIMHAAKEAVFRGVVNEVKDLFGVEHAGDLPLIDWPNPKTGRTEKRVNKLALKEQLMNKVAEIKTPQLKTAKENAEKEAKTATEKLSNIETEQNQLKKQWEAIRTELGLGNNSTQQQIIEKIKELKGGPTTSCTHSDYDTIKSQRDSLQTEVESKKRKISELEDADKENINVITKKVLIEKTDTGWKDWDVKLSEEQKQKIQNASTAEEVEEVRSEIIKKEFSKLKGENNGSLKLNIGLGVLALGSLLLLGWVLIRQNSSLPQVEPEKDKEKKTV